MKVDVPRIRVVILSGPPEDWENVIAETEDGELHIWSLTSDWLKTYASGQWQSVRRVA